MTCKAFRFGLLGLLTLLAAGATACSDITGNNEGNFLFDFLPLEYVEGMADSVDVLPAAGGVQVVGVIVLPSTCHGLEGRHTREGRTITMSVITRVINPSCPNNEPDAARYQFVSFGLGNGTVRLRVIHNVAGVGTTTMFDEEVSLTTGGN